MGGLPFRRRRGLQKNKGGQEARGCFLGGGEVLPRTLEEEGFVDERAGRRRGGGVRHKGWVAKGDEGGGADLKRGRWKMDVSGRGRLVVKTKKANAKQR